ncbi:MAG: pyruvate kinase [Lachnospiraceae bacterium]
MRKTKIVCTLGPACESEEMLAKLLQEGMDVARFNFSHGTQEQQKQRLMRLRSVASSMDRTVAALMDTKGPEIRLGDFVNGSAMLTRGSQFILTTEEMLGTEEKATITYKNLYLDIQTGMTILINDGCIEMVVENITETEITCRVITGGKVSNHKGVNVPGAVLSMPYINEVDESDIRFGANVGYDYIACSFVRCKEDILAVRKILEEEGSRMKIIAKIENMQGIDNLDEIIDVADGVMVARGDMGVEVPMEQVPILQKEMIKKAVAKGKQVITATQMLESMVSSPKPTRAETTDVANAIFDGTTAIMLSGETAAGEYPLEAVATMDKIARMTEQNINYTGRMRHIRENGTLDITTAISHATCQTAADIDAAAIITVTMSGFTAERICRYKPTCPIIACSTTVEVCRQMNLFYGVKPILIREEDHSSENLFRSAIKAAVKSGLVKKNDRVVLTAGLPLGESGNTNMVRVEIVD